MRMASGKRITNVWETRKALVKVNTKNGECAVQLMSLGSFVYFVVIF